MLFRPPNNWKRHSTTRLKKDIPQEPELERQTISFWDTFNEFVRNVVYKITGRMRHMKVCSSKKHLEDFDTNLTFEALNESKPLIMWTFYGILRTYAIALSASRWVSLDGFFAGLKRKDYNKNNTVELFSTQTENHTKVIFLTWAELTKLKEYKIPETKKIPWPVRDICCFSASPDFGIRMYSIWERSDIKENHIEITTVKRH